MDCHIPMKYRVLFHVGEQLWDAKLKKLKVKKQYHNDVVLILYVIFVQILIISVQSFLDMFLVVTSCPAS